MTDPSTPSADRPHFRADELAAELIEEGGARFVDVVDPDTGDSYRFYEAEYALACAMDGERDIAGIASWAQGELGMTASPQEISSVVATLGQLGYLQTGGEAAVATGSMAGAAAAIAAAAPEVGAQLATPPADDELVAGIVVGKAPAAPAPSSVDFELGTPGVPHPRPRLRRWPPLPAPTTSSSAPRAASPARRPRPPPASATTSSGPRGLHPSVRRAPSRPSPPPRPRLRRPPRRCRWISRSTSASTT
ncbi:MAG: hypothetical protein R2939_00190 [Kofleriaceae bacterium]